MTASICHECCGPGARAQEQKAKGTSRKKQKGKRRNGKRKKAAEEALLDFSSQVPYVGERTEHRKQRA